MCATCHLKAFDALCVGILFHQLSIEWSAFLSRLSDLWPLKALYNQCITFSLSSVHTPVVESSMPDDSQRFGGSWGLRGFSVDRWGENWRKCVILTKTRIRRTAFRHCQHPSQWMILIEKKYRKDVVKCLLVYTNVSDAPIYLLIIHGRRRSQGLNVY